MGKYLLLERLATGGMAEVYRAKAGGAGGFEKQVAIKRILPSYSQNDEFRKMFEYEARLSSMLTHANIVQIYDFNKFGETYLLAMEYVDGKNLRQSINKSRKVDITFSVEFSAFVVNEVCKGLEYAHSKRDDNTGKQLNIIHRDMSPQNIMLSYEGAVKIVDFGIAKAKDRVDETRSGVIKGKFGYMSPEQANGLVVDHRTDIFSTGIILWEMLTGRRLFAAESDLATLRMIQECVITPPSKINPRVGPDLERIVMKALSKDVKLRYNSAGELHRNLLEYLSRTASTFTQQEVAAVLQKVFAEEISKEKKRFEQLNRQSIPFSQRVAVEKSDDLDSIEEALEGFATKSDILDVGGETFSDAEVPVQSGLEPEAPQPTSISYTIDEELPSESVAAEEDSGVTKSHVTGIEGEQTQVSDQIQITNGSLRGEVDLVLPGGTKHGFSKDVATGPATRGLVLENEPPTPETRVQLAHDSMPIVAEGSLNSTQGELPVPALEGSEPSTLGGPTMAGSGVALSPPKIETVPPRMDVPSEFNNARSASSANVNWRSEKIFQEDRRKVPRKKKNFPTAVRFLLLMLVTGYGYKLYLDGEVEQYFESKTNHRQPTNQASTGAGDGNVAESESSEIKAVGGCTLNVRSIPPGAQVFEGKVFRGLTPLILTGSCGRALGITLQKEGYESLSESVVIGKKIVDWSGTLRAFPMGRLALNLGFNAEVFLDGVAIKEVRARSPLELALRAKRTYLLQLVNRTLNLDFRTEVKIEEGQKTDFSLSLDEATAKSRDSRK